MAKNKGGRPTVMTPDAIAKLEQAFSMGCTDLEACFHADISKDSLYSYQEKHPEFTERKEMLKDRLIFKARGVVENAVVTGDKDMAKWYLERKKKQEFSTRSESKTETSDVKGFLDSIEE